MKACHCQSKNDFDHCCGPFIANEKTPATPLELMRSRYSAYCLADVHYIKRTMKSPASDHFNPTEARAWANQVNWLNLEIVKHWQDEPTRGFVEFIAYYELKGKKQTIHEISEFRLDEGKWFYVDGYSPD